MDEHKKHINKNNTQKSVITDHRLINHEFNWDNIEILDEEPILKKDSCLKWFELNDKKTV